MARRRQRLDMQPARVERACDGRDAELRLLRDVVQVRVRAENVFGLDAPALGGGQERLHGRAGVDEDGRSALLVGHEVGVREPPWIHAALDKHRSLGYWDIQEEDIVASLWDRTVAIVKAKWNALLNRAEDPSETLEYSYEQQLT